MNNLNSFTDILGDEIADSQESQPFSISSGNSVEIVPSKCDAQVDSRNALQNRTKPAKRTGQYGQFRSVEEIAEKYRHVFSYPFFNLVQSSVIEDALYSDKSMVVCAPTGSGKTVVFEMAIVQLLMELEDKQYTDDFKIIYMAPVKALCTERLTEWYPKFTKLGLMCIEVTGDTDVDFSQLKPYRIIITTPEKWDMVTRRWREHRQLVEVVKLFLIDEVHILNDATRGPVLEAVVSRMNTIEASAQSAHRIEQLQKQYQNMEDNETPQEGPIKATNPPKIRFVAVSATVGNPGDVAAWLGNADKPAVYYKFGDESRPVKLKRIVEGYPCPDGTSIFKFDIILNYKLWPVIQKYYNGKPTLIFCNTRKSVALTAEALSREITVTFSPEQKAKLTALASTIKNKKLQMLVLRGVGCHHAGLLYEERNNIENAFRNRDLPILITTTTLAMGVNLPAHLVIIKNTQQYVNGAYQEYSISTVLQMVGRAGRPQYDSEATAVIMTRLQDKPRYQALVGGSEPLQSYLHKRLPENLNSEAALGTVNDVAQCVQWLRSTFLCVRAAQDPKRYLGLPPTAPQQQISKKIEELCVKAMNSLATAGLITMDEASCIESTEAGRLMSVFYLDLETMKQIMKINGSETLERLLWVICESHELADMHLRVDERRTLNLLNRNNAAATIRFPMKGKISTRQMKLNCMIQAILGCLNIPDPSLNQEAMKVMRTADRVCKCLVAYLTRPALVSSQSPYYNAVLNALLLAKCVSAHLWENSPYVSKQLRGIGPTFSTLLATAGKVNFMLLEESHPRDLERIMNKGPPAGNVLRKQVSLLPKYQLTMTPVDEKSVTVQLVLLNQNHLSENMEQLTAGDAHKSYLVVGDSENNLLLFLSFKDKDLIRVFDGVITHQITRKLNFEHKMFAHCISSSFVGIDAQSEYTFKDLEAVYSLPPIAVSEDFVVKKTSTKQTTITDTFKERKRKSTSENNVSQSKEKKKRENALLENFKCLKESFGKTTKDLKDDLGKTALMSNKILQDLGHLEKSTISSELIPENNFGDIQSDLEINSGPIKNINTNTEHFDDNDFIDDDKIDKILNEIDEEISKGHHSDLPAVNISSNKRSRDIQNAVMKPNLSSVFTKDKTIAHETTYGIHTSLNKGMSKIPVITTPSNKNYKVPFNNPQKHLQKNTTSRTKLNFVNLLAKHTNLDNDDDAPAENAATGFSDAIKTHIQKYLQQTKDISNNPDKSLQITELVGVSNKCVQQNKSTSNIPVVEKNIINDHSKVRIDNSFEPEPKDFIRNISLLERQEDTIEIREKNTTDMIKDTQNEVEETQGNKSRQNELLDPNNGISGKSTFDTTAGNELNEILESTVDCIDTTPRDNNQTLIEETYQIESEDIDAKDSEHILYTENNNPNTRYTVTEILEPVKDNIHMITDKTFLPQMIQHSNPLQMMGQQNNQQVQTTDLSIIPYKPNKIQEICDVETRPAKAVLLSENVNGDKNCFSTAIRLSTPSYQIQMATHNIFSNHKQIQNPTYSSNSVCRVRETTNKKVVQNQINSSLANTSTRYLQDSSDSTISQFSISNNQYENKEHSYYRYNSNSDSNQYQNANVRNYAYSATKIDVASRNDDTTVIRKIQMDLNITEIVAQRRGMNYIPDQQRVENRENTYDMFSSNTLNLITLPSTSKCFTNKGTLQNYNVVPKTVLGSKTLRLKNNEFPTNKQELNPDENSTKINRMENQEIKCIELQKPSQINENQRNDETNSLTLYSQQTEQTHTKIGNTTQSIHTDTNDSNIKCETTQKEDKKIENILQKYRKILNKDKTGTFSQKISQSQLRTQTDSINITQREKPKRPFKISDIQNMNAPLSKIIITPSYQEVNNSNKNTQDNVEDDNIDINQREDPVTYNAPLPYNVQPEYKTEEEINFERKVQAQNLAEIKKVASNIQEDLSEFHIDDTLIEELDSKEAEVSFDIDHSMFNPKTLLQCYNDDSDVYVPPPPEFCDGSQLEREDQETQDSIPTDCYEPGAWENTQDVPQDNISQTESQIELTPRKEIETWSFSQHDESYQNVSSPAGYNSRQSFTIMHTPRLHNRPFQNVSVPRQNRLEQFIFSHKKKLPKA